MMMVEPRPQWLLESFLPQLPLLFTPSKTPALTSAVVTKTSSLCFSFSLLCQTLKRHPLYPSVFTRPNSPPLCTIYPSPSQPSTSLAWLLLIPSFRRCFFFSQPKTPVAFFFPFDVLLSLRSSLLRLLFSFSIYIGLLNPKTQSFLL